MQPNPIQTDRKKPLEADGASPHSWSRFRQVWQKKWQSAGVYGIFSLIWTAFWMRFAGLSVLGRIATCIATWFAPPFKARRYLARLNSKGYISPSANIYQANLRLGANVFIGERVDIFQSNSDGLIELGDRVHLHRDSIIEVGSGGSLKIGADTHIQPRCQLTAYKECIQIGRGVQIAPNCAFYPYDHGFAPGKPIQEQPLQTKGGITIDDDAWLGCGAIVLSGVRIGKGAVVGAGAVVTHDIPDGAIAAGVPARVVKMRSDS
jgi:acetyltransferase-like isoleucine patch superfamily enzyme